MTPGARIAAAIELLSAIDDDPRPADRVVGAYFRTRRYMGSKDRRAVAGLTYAVLRRRARLDWWLARVASEVSGARARVLAALALAEGKGGADIAAFFDGAGYNPTPLSAEENRLLAALDGQALDHPDQPPWVRGELPEWLLPAFEEAFGEALAEELAALAAEAPLDLRVNSLKADRAGAIAALAEDGLAAQPTTLSPLGLRLPGRRALPTVRAFKEGLVEVQDESSQVAALLTDARPGMTVADYCAGAGGKTLALAAAMGNEGRIVALDPDAGRLGRAERRIARAGVEIVELHALESDDDRRLVELTGACDRVLVDTPCSGSGAWRRNPEARWRLEPDMLADYCELQAELLNAAASLVAPGGRLIYATCSLIPAENGRRVARFLEGRSDFAPIPVAEVWAATLGGACPAGREALQLTPACHGTDGFFLAILERGGAR